MKRIILLVGIPGAGKSTYVKQLTNTPEVTAYINADSVRKQLYGDENIQGNGKEVFDVVYQNFINDLKDHTIQRIIIDNTNISFKTRKNYYQLIKEHYPYEDYKIDLIFFTNFEKAIERNKSRKRVVPDEVMERMISNFEGPNEWEKYNCYIKKIEI